MYLSYSLWWERDWICMYWINKSLPSWMNGLANEWLWGLPHPSRLSFSEIYRQVLRWKIICGMCRLNFNSLYVCVCTVHCIFRSSFYPYDELTTSSVPTSNVDLVVSACPMWESHPRSMDLASKNAKVDTVAQWIIKTQMNVNLQFVTNCVNYGTQLQLTWEDHPQVLIPKMQKWNRWLGE